MDVSKAFKDVLLEQVVIVVSDRFSKDEEYLSLVPEEKEKMGSFQVKKEIVKEYDTLLIGIDPAEMGIFNKAVGCKLFMRDISESSRGLPFQRFLSEKSNVKHIPIYRGDHIARYHLFETADSIPERVLEEAEKKVEFLQQPKVLSQRIVAHVLQPTDHIILMATKDDVGVLTLDTVENTVLTDERFSPGFVTCLINSKFYSWYAYRFIFSKAIRTMDFDEYYIDKLPICQINFQTSAPERKRLTDSLNSLVKSGRYSDIFRAIDEYLPMDKKGRLVEGKERSDVVHDLLASLAQKMVEMKGDKHKYSKEFLAWLEREIIKGSIEDLKDKSKIKAFYESDIRVLVEVLKQNGVFPKILELGDMRYATLEKGYNDTMSELKPVMERSVAIDNLIDQVIYRLYGLTSDEIKLVEGKA